MPEVHGRARWRKSLGDSAAIVIAAGFHRLADDGIQAAGRDPLRGGLAVRMRASISTRMAGTRRPFAKVIGRRLVVRLILSRGDGS
jgi:hypothetical protein